jgi:hypothetical protein
VQNLNQPYNLFVEKYRIVIDVGVYTLTFIVVDRLPIFIDETPCRWL